MFLSITVTLPENRSALRDASQGRGGFLNYLRGRTVIQDMRNRDFYYILAFLGLFTALTGVWFCMHQAFIYQSEYLIGTLPSPMYQFLGIAIDPRILHVIGQILDYIGVTGVWMVIILKRLFEEPVTQESRGDRHE